jgi:inosine-uridine nucleoside N-ribohydrolase
VEGEIHQPFIYLFKQEEIMNFMHNRTYKMMGLFILYFFLGICVAINAQVKIIFDTDFGGDADDLGALAMLNHFQNKGEADLLAVMCWNTEKYAVSAIDAVNTYYGNPDIPIGLRQGSSHEAEWNHSKIITENLDYDATQENVAEATILYRKILSEADDHSLIIITVGPLMNIKKLISSQADEISLMDGKQLINAKVKEFVIMGGQFPNGKDEWNFNGNMPGVTKFVLDHIKVPITFSGFELGESLKTGEIFNNLPQNSPIYLGFLHFSKHAPWIKENYKDKILDNSTFDQTAVLYAVRNGVGQYWYKVKDGLCVADSTGGNKWIPMHSSKHSYLVLDKPVEEMELELEAFMLGDF